MRGPSLDRSRVGLALLIALLAVGAWMFVRSRGDARPAFPEPNGPSDVRARANVAAPAESDESDATSFDPQIALVAESEAATETEAPVRPARISAARKRGPKWSLTGSIAARRPGVASWGVDVVVRSLGSGDVVWSAQGLQPEHPNTMTGRFQLDQLYEDAYVLSASSTAGFSVQPSEVTVRRSDPQLQLTLANDEPGYDLRITLHDPDRRKITTNASAEVRVIGAHMLAQSRGATRDGVLDLRRRVSLRARYDLLIVADGFMPLGMNSEALLSHLDMSAAEAPFDLELEPGWGVELRFECAQGPESCRLDGIDVKCDGEFAGTTDANGVLLLRRTQRPTRMQLDSSLVRSANGGDEIEVPEPGTLRWAWSVQRR